MAAKPGRAPRMRAALRASGRRESSMAETAAGPGGSPGPAAAPSPRGSAGPQEDERCPGGPSPETGGAAPEPGSAEAVLQPPGRKGTPGSSGRKKRGAGSPGEEPPPPPGPAGPAPSPAAAAPPGRRRSWRRSSLTGRRSRRKSLPPVHRDVTDLSQSISLELPEVERLSLLLLSSFQFSARKLREALAGSAGFDPAAFAAAVQAGGEGLRGLLQRLRQDGTLGSCTGPPGDSRDPALEGSVAQVKQLMASLSGELQAWDRLLQQHLQRSQDTDRALEQLRAGAPPGSPPAVPRSRLGDPKPAYGAILARHRPALAALRLRVDEAQQAGKMLLEFHRESRDFLRGLSEQLASRAFRNLPGSPARRLLEKKPQKAPPAGGKQ